MKENETFAKETVNDETPIENLLHELSEELDCKSSTPEELSRAMKKRKLKTVLKKRAEENLIQKRYRSYLSEIDALRSKYSDFEIENELENPVFAKLIRCGFGMEAAYNFVHHDEIIEKVKLEAEQTGYENAVALLRSGNLRPEENGTRDQSGISEKKNVASLTGGGIRDILRKVEKGAKVKF
ncbi:MAG: hypothetical protein IKL36_04155 [Clostridia bacterium]|nr:hypothetical protein [Clostridia bacterium]